MTNFISSVYSNRLELCGLYGAFNATRWNNTPWCAWSMTRVLRRIIIAYIKICALLTHIRSHLKKHQRREKYRESLADLRTEAPTISRNACRLLMLAAALRKLLPIEVINRRVRTFIAICVYYCYLQAQ